MGEIEESFKLFMDWVVFLNGLHKLGQQILQEYAKHLEAYRRAKSEEAEYITRVVASAPSHHLSDYLGPGGWLEGTSRTFAAKLDSATTRLWIYLNEVHDCLDHLTGISKDAIKEQSENDVTVQLERFSLSVAGEDEVEAERARQNDHQSGRISFSEYSSMMALIYNMLQEDYEMQRKIVEALGLDTPSDVLKKYCSVWAEQPCVKSYMIDRARSWVEDLDQSMH
ncbi:hypothetical protein R1flu_004502 [Riccia fluitans]|uniref:DUF7795 domain-containing protein n=1 Tax=Riccia fluitans TaxID=41844 RepID=A0ABD1YR25_9MARC